jgi:hypothetical protein
VAILFLFLTLNETGEYLFECPPCLYSNAIMAGLLGEIESRLLRSDSGVEERSGEEAGSYDRRHRLQKYVPLLQRITEPSIEEKKQGKGGGKIGTRSEG